MDVHHEKKPTSKPNVGVNVVKYKTKNGDKTKATWDYQLGI